MGELHSKNFKFFLTPTVLDHERLYQNRSGGANLKFEFASWTKFGNPLKFLYFSFIYYPLRKTFHDSVEDILGIGNAELMLELRLELGSLEGRRLTLQRLLVVFLLEPFGDV